MAGGPIPVGGTRWLASAEPAGTVGMAAGRRPIGAALAELGAVAATWAEAATWAGAAKATVIDCAGEIACRND